MHLNTAAALILAAGVLALGYFWPAKADLNSVVPYAAQGWFEVECSDVDCIRYNPRTGESWIMACPGAPKGCEWDPIEVREP